MKNQHRVTRLRFRLRSGLMPRHAQTTLFLLTHLMNSYFVCQSLSSHLKLVTAFLLQFTDFDGLELRLLLLILVLRIRAQTHPGLGTYVRLQ